jgi:hypothetical protein
MKSRCAPDATHARQCAARGPARRLAATSGTSRAALERMVLAFAGRLLQGLNASAPSLSSKGRCSLRMAGPAMPGDCPGGQAASLDRSVFAQQWRVFALRVPPKLTQGTVKALKDHVLRVPRVAAVSKAGGVESDRFVLLRYFAAPPPDVPFSPRGNMEMSLIGDSAAVVEKLRVEKFSGKVSEEVERLVREVSEASLVDTVVELGYEHWSIESVLGRLLPAGTTMCVPLSTFFPAWPFLKGPFPRGARMADTLGLSILFFLASTAPCADPLRTSQSVTLRTLTCDLSISRTRRSSRMCCWTS